MKIEVITVTSDKETKPPTDRQLQAAAEEIITKGGLILALAFVGNPSGGGSYKLVTQSYSCTTDLCFSLEDEEREPEEKDSPLNCQLYSFAR
jgi:hypothetical protein